MKGRNLLKLSSIQVKQDTFYIAIFDNGSVFEDQFDEIMKLDQSTKSDASKLGVFGVGLKSSSLAQADSHHSIPKEMVKHRCFDVSQRLTS